MEGETLNTFSMVMIGLGAFIGLIAIIYVIRLALTERGGEVGGWTFAGASRNITAIARTALAEGMRARIALGFIILILISVPFFYLTSVGDGTIKGRIQMFMTYTLGFSTFVLALLTVIFSCRSLSNEITSRQIFGIVSKPVPRWQIIAGKWVGVMVLNVIMIAIVGLATYGGVQLILHNFKKTLVHELTTDGGLTPTQADRMVASLDRVEGIGVGGVDSPVVTAMKDATGMSRSQVADVLLRLAESTRVNLRRFDEMRRQVLVARATISPDIDEDALRKAVLARYEAKEKAGVLPVDMQRGEILEQLQHEVWGDYCTIPPGTYKRWEMMGPSPKRDADLIMALRFTIKTQSLIQSWQDPETGQFLEKDTLVCIWSIGDRDDPRNLTLFETQPVDTAKEIEFPVVAVEDDGKIVLEFFNADPRRISAVFDLPKAIQVLYVVGSFESNMFQTCLALLIPLACLTTFGVFASTFLTFPVGALILVFLYIVSSSMGFVAESLAVTDDYIDPSVKQPLSFEVRKATVQGIQWLLSIGDLDPLEKLMEGRVIGWDKIGYSFLMYVVLKSGLTLFIAVLVFRRRELAAVTV